jgi:DNA-binding response OmpR family regulator
LNKAGYTVWGVVHSIDLAIPLIWQESPDIVLLDMNLDDAVVGSTLGERLAMENIPFIYLSSDFQDYGPGRELMALAQAILTKPLRETELILTMELILRRQQQETGAVPYKVRQLDNSFSAIIDGSTDRIGNCGKLQVLQAFMPFDCLNIRVMMLLALIRSA